MATPRKRPDVALSFSAWVCLSLLAMAGAAWAGPCTSAAVTCTEWVSVAGGPARALVYRTHALDSRSESLTRALVVVHGAGRDADNYFRHALAAAFLAGALEDTLVISPRFPSNDGGRCRDWTCEAGPDSWRTGGAAVGNAQVAAFDVADELLRKLARKDVLPNLRIIVVAGHSAGGQFVTRYEMANQVHEGLGVPISYVVANPSSYAYLDGLRPTPGALPTTVAAASPGYTPPAPAKPPTPFAAFSDARNCTAYDSWPYGFQHRAGYSARIADDRLRKQLAARPATYLLGELDILPLYGFDASCPAMAQGPTRLARGLMYGRYVNEKHGAQHRTVVVPACGHSARCMFTAEAALPLIFPKP